MVSLSISRSKSRRSFFVYLLSSPFSLCSTSSSSLVIRFLISEKFERVPPIQRPATYGIPSSELAFIMASRASLLPPTQRAIAPSCPLPSTKALALSNSLLVFSRSKISRLFLEPKINVLAEGCRRDFTKPKCAPTEKRASITLLPVFLTSFVFSIYFMKSSRKNVLTQQAHRMFSSHLR